MILADKIIDLRKKQGWSQEELAEQLGVSRQSVSKWESGMSVPDLNKIIAMSELFGVSTDYLIKDELEKATPSETASRDDAVPVRTVSAEEANAYMATVEKHSPRIALGVVLCVLSPITLILLGGFAALGWMGEAVALAIGLAALFVLVGTAVAFFIPNGLALSEYEYLDQEDFTLAYGVQGIVEKRQAAYRPHFITTVTVCVLLCIGSVMPLLLAGILTEKEHVHLICLAVLIAVCAVAVGALVHTCYIWGSYGRLLQTGEFAKFQLPKPGRGSAVKEAVSGSYWCLVTGIYLLWSFLSGDWHITWITWIIGAAGQGVIEAFFYKKK